MSQASSRQIHADEASRLHLTVRARLVPLFFPILQKGFLQKMRAGGSLRELLSDQFGLSQEYIESRIQTIFLDGKPVDDLDTATVRDGTSLALSSAMPGVLGASLRRGGYYSGMRSQITHVEKPEPPRQTDGRITVKLFNLTIRELGPLFLERGIWMDAGDARDFFQSLPQDWVEGCVEATLDGSGVDPAMIPSREFTAGQVHIQIQTA
jgi:hypothetical protein